MTWDTILGIIGLLLGVGTIVIGMVVFFISIRSLLKENTALLREISERSFREHAELLRHIERNEERAHEYRKDQALEHKEMLVIMGTQNELLARMDERLDQHVDEQRGS